MKKYEIELVLYQKAGYQVQPVVLRYIDKLFDVFFNSEISGFNASWIIGIVKGLLYEKDIEHRIQNDLLIEDLIGEYRELLNVVNTNQLSTNDKREVLRLFSILASHRVLTPLQGTPEEWRDVSEYGGGIKFQNIRDSRVFQNDIGKFFMIDAYSFEDEKGFYYTNRNSHLEFGSFPFMPPETIYITYNERRRIK